MKAGVAVFFTQYSITPIRLALALEERGYEPLWAPEHSHIPVSRNSDFPKGGALPEKYQDVMDPFVYVVGGSRSNDLYKNSHRYLSCRPTRPYPKGKISCFS